jgi:xylulose-5-phosphate/fructose-6-phosphate phosphoketolase
LPDEDFDRMFTKDKPVIFAYHGYPPLIHTFTYRRTNHDNIHVRGFKEEGTTTTPFDMCVRNDLDRFRLVLDVYNRVPKLAAMREAAEHKFTERRQAHMLYVTQHGEDMPEVRNWRWSGQGAKSAALDTGGDNA